MRLTAFSDIALRVLLLTGAAPAGRKLTTRAIAEGVPGRRISYEIPGPDRWMLHGEARDAVVA